MKAKPWITPAIIKSIRVKNKLYKQFLKTNSNYYHSKYKFYRNRLNYLTKLSKRKYYSDYFLNNRNDSKKTWKGIKEIINPKNKGLHTPSTLQYNNEVITDTKTIANAFNEFFANVGRHLASAIPTVNKLPKST